MNLRVKIYLFFVLTSCALNGYAQNIENIDFYSEGKNVIVTYELKNCSPDERYDITLSFVDQKSNQHVIPKTIIGNLKNQECGNKRIVWEISKDLQYISGKFYPELNFKLSPKGPTDADGYVYKTVKIGNQEWFAENLRTSKYNDSSSIPNVTDKDQWSSLTIGAWVYYNNDFTNNVKYGKLYNWYSINPSTNGNKNLCPKGWHIPTDLEWTILTDYLGGTSIAGGKMKEEGVTNWNSPNLDATNLSLFTGLPCGNRDNNGDFYSIGYDCAWWSSTDNKTRNAWLRYLFFANGNANRYSENKKYGFSIRCLRD